MKLKEGPKVVVNCHTYQNLKWAKWLRSGGEFEPSTAQIAWVNCSLKGLSELQSYISFLYTQKIWRFEG